MRKLFYFLSLVALLAACAYTDDSVLAEVFGSKLFLSDVQRQVPDYLSGKDSVDFAKKIIADWTVEQLLLHEANKTLSPSERDFTKELNTLRNNLLIQAYCDKITADTNLFPVSDNEIKEFIRAYGINYSVEKEIIKLNYIKLHKKSKLIPKLKKILEDEELRQSRKEDIEKLCADTIEYFIDDDKWLYLEDVEAEFPLKIKNKEQIEEGARFLEIEDAEYHYLVVLLGYRKHYTAEESGTNIHENARNLIRQQKRTQFIKAHIEELKEK